MAVFEQTIAAHYALQQQLEHTLTLALTEQWDELHERVPGLVAQMQSLPVALGGLNPAQQQELAVCIQRTDELIQALQPVLQNWQTELARLLSNLNTEQKVHNAYQVRF